MATDAALTAGGTPTMSSRETSLEIPWRVVEEQYKSMPPKHASWIVYRKGLSIRDIHDSFVDAFALCRERNDALGFLTQPALVGTGDGVEQLLAGRTWKARGYPADVSDHSFQDLTLWADDGLVLTFRSTEDGVEVAVEVREAKK
jgi:hypothetical protein